MTATRYTQQTARELCDRIAGGESLTRVCEDPAMPSRKTVYRWLERKEKFRVMFAQACGLREDGVFDSILDRVDDITPETAKAAKVQIDALKWVLGRMNPTKYGDRQQVEVTGKDGGPVEGKITVEFVAPRPEGADNG